MYVKHRQTVFECIMGHHIVMLVCITLVLDLKLDSTEDVLLCNKDAAEELQWINIYRTQALLVLVCGVSLRSR